MLEDLQSRSAAILAPVLGWLRKPGEWLWQWLEHHLPAIAERLAGGAADPDTMLVTVLAIVSWLAALLLFLGVLRLARTVLRSAERLAAIARFRLAYWFATLRTRIACRFERLSWRSRQSVEVHEHVDLDELDLAVLSRGAMLAPGFALSVPEIAEQLRRRPAQVQRSLDKLHNHQLVDPLLGSTDGYGTYRLTDSGAWFVAACRRNRAAAFPAPDRAGEA